ncbi:RING finger protein narya-like [Anopheles ziemanni]|uniref:RING finger protein narya-like n=1 Tax=Anopheles coustani TaxID=139045 RepID=UPI00265A82D0|nr:RING finger protein narya-like [Anopheles coustani]XP_058177655.1 RING finger protein narya-like [Anopheles ziemanni]
MAPPNWIHCSLCYNHMAKKERQFYHLSCRHILCRPCMAKTKRGTVCPVCQGSLSRFVELNNQMERKDKMLYDPSAAKIYAIACQTLIFQQKHRQHLIQRIIQMRSSLPRLNELESQLRKHVMQAQRRYEKMRSFRRTLQDSLRRSISSSSSRSTTQQSITFANVRIPTRRLSTESTLGSIPYTPQRKTAVESFNGSFGVQTFGSRKIMHRRFSNDSGIESPCNSSFTGSAKRVSFNLSATSLNRSLLNTNSSNRL